MSACVRSGLVYAWASLYVDRSVDVQPTRREAAVVYSLLPCRRRGGFSRSLLSLDIFLCIELSPAVLRTLSRRLHSRSRRNSGRERAKTMFADARKEERGKTRQPTRRREESNSEIGRQVLPAGGLADLLTQ